MNTDSKAPFTEKKRGKNNEGKRVIKKKLEKGRYIYSKY